MYGERMVLRGCFIALSPLCSGATIAGKQVCRAAGSGCQSGCWRDICIWYRPPPASSQHKSGGGEGMAGGAERPSLLAACSRFPPAKNKNAGGGEPEENKIGGHHVVEDLVIAPGQCYDRGPHALQNYGHNGHAGMGIHVGHPAEEQPIL